MRFPFRKVDDEVGVEDALTHKVAVIALAVSAAGQRCVVIVNGELVRFAGNRLEVTLGLELHLAVTGRVAVGRRGIFDELIPDLLEHDAAQVAEREPARELPFERDDPVAQTRLLAQQRPVRALLETVANRDALDGRKQLEYGSYRFDDHARVGHERFDWIRRVGLVHHPVRLDDDLGGRESSCPTAQLGSHDLADPR